MGGLVAAEHFLFVRHAESSKNLAERLSGPTDLDSLSDDGIARCRELAASLAEFSERTFHGMPVSVSCSTSPRAEQTAGLLAKQFDGSFISSELLGSMVVPETGGRSEAELRSLFPNSWAALQHYRHGLRSSYTIEFVGARLRAFEDRVVRGLNIVSTGPGAVNIVVAHRSTITALLMHFARRAQYIPDHHFGFVPLGLLSVSHAYRDAGVSHLGFVNRSGAQIRGGLSQDGWPLGT